MKQLLSVGTVLIFAAVCARLVPHPPNVTPVIAMALVGGIYMDWRTGLIVPLAALFLSDIILGFHGLMLYVYGSVILTILLGRLVQRKKNYLTLTGASLCSSILFFVVTNAGVWFQGGGRFYPMTIDGLLMSYTFALPFFRNAILGDLFYVGLLVGLFEFARRHGYLPDYSPREIAPSTRKVVEGR